MDSDRRRPNVLIVYGKYGGKPKRLYTGVKRVVKDGLNVFLCRDGTTVQLNDSPTEYVNNALKVYEDVDIIVTGAEHAFRAYERSKRSDSNNWGCLILM